MGNLAGLSYLWLSALFSAPCAACCRRCRGPVCAPLPPAPVPVAQSSVLCCCWLGGGGLRFCLCVIVATKNLKCACSRMRCRSQIARYRSVLLLLPEILKDSFGNKAYPLSTFNHSLDRHSPRRYLSTSLPGSLRDSTPAMRSLTRSPLPPFGI